MRRWMSGVALLGGATAVMLTVAAWTTGKPLRQKRDGAGQGGADCSRTFRGDHA